MITKSDIPMGLMFNSSDRSGLHYSFIEGQTLLWLFVAQLLLFSETRRGFDCVHLL